MSERVKYGFSWWENTLRCDVLANEWRVGVACVFIVWEWWGTNEFISKMFISPRLLKHCANLYLFFFLTVFENFISKFVCSYSNKLHTLCVCFLLLFFFSLALRSCMRLTEKTSSKRRRACLHTEPGGCHTRTRHVPARTSTRTVRDVVFVCFFFGQRLVYGKMLSAKEPFDLQTLVCG